MNDMEETGNDSNGDRADFRNKPTTTIELSDSSEDDLDECDEKTVSA